MKKNIIVGVLLAVALALGLYGTLRSTPTAVTERIIREVGAATGPELPYKYLSVGGVRTWYSHSTSFPTATSTLCSFQSPAATTTLVAATMNIKNTTGTNTFQVGRAAAGASNVNSTATTTLLASLTVGSVSYGELVATTTLTASGLTDGVIIPYSWINFKVGTGTPGTITFTGSCSAVFREL